MESLNKETYKYLKSTESRMKQKVALRYWRWKNGKMEHTIFNHVFKKWYFDKETTDICGNVVYTFLDILILMIHTLNMLSMHVI